MKTTILCAIFLLNAYAYIYAADAYRDYALDEVDTTERGGQACVEKYDAIKQRIQDVVDEYNRLDKEAQSGGGTIR